MTKAKEPRSFFGAASQIRTGDLILTKDALYRLSYSSVLAVFPDSLLIILWVPGFVNMKNEKNRKNFCGSQCILYRERKIKRIFENSSCNCAGFVLG